MKFFDTVEMAPPDPILGLNAAFKADPRSNKVNLSIGAYKTDDLQPLVLAAVRKAEGQILTEGMDKEYLSQDGNPEYVQRSIRLCLTQSKTISLEHKHPAEPPVSDSLASFSPKSEIKSSIFRIRPGQITTKFSQEQVLDRLHHIRTMMRSAGNLPSHVWSKRSNPFLVEAQSCFMLVATTQRGLDPTASRIGRNSPQPSRRKGCCRCLILPIKVLDAALTEDAMAVRHFLADGHQMLVANSYSKNFGLYGERIGGFYVVTADAASAERVRSQVMRIIRANYSSPPLHGSRIIATVLASDTLRQEWETELAVMRERISGIRKALAEGLNAGSSSVDFSFMYKQNGMFSYSGLSKAAVDQLREEYAIYMPTNGRLNVAGLSPKNLDYVVEAILTVL